MPFLKWKGKQENKTGGTWCLSVPPSLGLIYLGQVTYYFCVTVLTLIMKMTASMTRLTYKYLIAKTF